MKPIIAADLFCGAGGTSEGLLRAGRDLSLDINLLAVNHWPVAINSHTLNHPGVRHRCESLETIKPRAEVPGGHLHLMAASPECTHHSIAAAGRPKNDQSRASAWHICRWAADLTVDNIFIENVREFQDWGPLYSDHSNGCKHEGTEDDPCSKKCHYNKPIPERKGETFRAFIQTLQSMSYTVEWRVQCAAEFGDPTSRKRLIILAKRGNKPIVWPKPTHGEGLLPYRTARQCIDWELKGKSIFGRRKDLSPNTLRRIAAGLKKFGGENAKPFLIKLYGTNETADVDQPMPTVTAGGNHLGLCEPFIIGTGGPVYSAKPKSVDEPMNTVMCETHAALVEPFILPHPGNGDDPQSCDKPLRTITATSCDMMLVQPFLVGVTHSQNESNFHSVNKPMPTLTTAKGGEYALVQPFLVPYHSGKGREDERAHSVDEPLRTQDTQNRYALCEPFLAHLTHHGADESRCHGVDEPVPTVTGAHRGELALIEPFLTKYYNTGISKSVDEPLDTVTSKDRFVLVEPKKTERRVDILLRMLQPHELQAAMSFPETYKFYGSREQQVKQIGNAVPAELARAHCKALLTES